MEMVENLNFDESSSEKIQLETKDEAEKIITALIQEVVDRNRLSLTPSKELLKNLVTVVDGEVGIGKSYTLKKYVRENPSIVGADSSWEDYEEFPLRSLDTVDVFFRSAENCIAVEVKSSVSDKYPLDYERGLYQTIKYAALLEAMALSQEHKIPSSIKSILLLETELPYEYKKLAKALNVTVIEKIKPPV